MHFNFVVGSDGAYEAGQRGDVCIVVDVLRTSSTIVAALAGGIQGIIPVTEMQTLNSDHIIIGEKEGLKVPGCSYGNSPIELLNNQHPNQVLYFVSTNGTPCILSSISADSIVLIGSLLNARAVGHTARQLAVQYHKNISLVLAGYHGALEDDDLIAGSFIYYAALSDIPVVGEILPIKTDNVLEALLHSKACQRLLKLDYGDDIRFCAQVDYTDIVPFYNAQTGKIEKYQNVFSPSNPI